MSGKCLSVLFLLCALLLTIPGGAVPLSYRVGLGDDPEVPRILREFTDVSPEAWYGESLAFVCQRGLFQGTSATTFSPLQPMTALWGPRCSGGTPGAPGTSALPPQFRGTVLRLVCVRRLLGLGERNPVRRPCGNLCAGGPPYP